MKTYARIDTLEKLNQAAKVIGRHDRGRLLQSCIESNTLPLYCHLTLLGSKLNFSYTPSNAIEVQLTDLKTYP